LLVTLRVTDRRRSLCTVVGVGLVRNPNERTMRMFRSVLGKVAWMGRTTSMVLGLAVVLTLVVGLADAALGANGQAWIIGQINKATSTTQLNASVGGKPALLVTNSNKAPASRALHLNVAQGKAPMAVNSDTRVPRLNADMVDGLDSARLAGTGDSTYRGGSSVCGFGGTPFTSTLPVSVDKESLLFATARAGIQANGNANANVTMDVDLRNAENTITLASTGFPSGAISANSFDIRDLVSEGVLKSDISTPSEARFVLRPGVNYLLRQTVRLNGATCASSSPAIWSSSLSYIQLGTP